jgi:TonB family protein
LSWKVIAGWALWVFFLSTAAIVPGSAVAQEESTRKVKTKVDYPDLAGRMSIHGMVKLVVVVAPNGTPKDTKVVGGNPLLVNAALDAVKQWKFETGAGRKHGDAGIQLPAQLSGIGHPTARAGPGR